jgi:exopolysaccharide production protein ExoQ
VKSGPAVAWVRDRSGHSVDWLAWIATVLCMLGLIVTLGGSAMGALLFLGAWAAVAMARADRCLLLIFRSPELWLIAALALLSVLWSQTPAVTLRAAAELILTVGVASLTAGFLRPREFVSAMSVSLLFGAVLSLMFGRYGVDGMTNETVFLGIFASKNTMALFMSFLAIFAAAVLADRDQPPVLRLLGMVSFLLSLPLLLLAHSVGALLTTAGSFAVLVLAAIFARLRSPERMLMLACAATIAVPILIVTALLSLNGTLGEETSTFITGVLGKDATLTGRTVLWQIALAEIAKRPWLGTGYYGFWLQGNLLAESIWRYFSIESRSGFTFHDTFLEFAVELGWVGVATLVFTLVLAIERSIRLALKDRTFATASLVAVIFCLTTRTFGEVDAPYPFAVGTFLLFVVAAYGADYAGAVRRNARAVLVQSLVRDPRSEEQPKPAV